MTPLEIAGVVLISMIALLMFTIWIDLILNIIKRKKLNKELKNITNEIFKNIDNDIKELKRAEFFEDLEKIKKENEEDNNGERL